MPPVLSKMSRWSFEESELLSQKGIMGVVKYVAAVRGITLHFPKELFCSKHRLPWCALLISLAEKPEMLGGGYSLDVCVKSWSLFLVTPDVIIPICWFPLCCVPSTVTMPELSACSTHANCEKEEGLRIFVLLAEYDWHVANGFGKMTEESHLKFLNSFPLEINVAFIKLSFRMGNELDAEECYPGKRVYISHNFFRIKGRAYLFCQGLGCITRLCLPSENKYRKGEPKRKNLYKYCAECEPKYK